jgi:hypothetical protein
VTGDGISFEPAFVMIVRRASVKTRVKRGQIVMFLSLTGMK